VGSIEEMGFTRRSHLGPVSSREAKEKDSEAEERRAAGLFTGLLFDEAMSRVRNTLPVSCRAITQEMQAGDWQARAQCFARRFASDNVTLPNLDSPQLNFSTYAEDVVLPGDARIGDNPTGSSLQGHVFQCGDRQAGLSYTRYTRQAFPSLKLGRDLAQQVKLERLAIEVPPTGADWLVRQALTARLQHHLDCATLLRGLIEAIPHAWWPTRWEEEHTPIRNQLSDFIEAEIVKAAYPP
jgi:hypothetical protein